MLEDALMGLLGWIGVNVQGLGLVLTLLFVAHYAGKGARVGGLAHYAKWFGFLLAALTLLDVVDVYPAVLMQLVGRAVGALSGLLP